MKPLPHEPGRQTGNQEPWKRLRGESEGSSLHLDTHGNAVERPTVSVLLEHGFPTVSLEIEVEPKRLIVDTGSNVSILQPGVSQSDVSATSIKPYGFTGEALNIRGQQHVSFVLDGRKFDHTFLVCPIPTEADGLVTAKIELEKERSLPSLVCVEPATIPREGILPARVLSRGGTSVHETSARSCTGDAGKF